MVLFRNGTDRNWSRTHFSLSFPTCKRSPSFWNRSTSFFPEPVVLLSQPFQCKPYASVTPYIFAAIWPDKKKKAAPRKAATKAVKLWKEVEMKSRCCLIRSFKNTSLSYRIHCYCPRSSCSLLSKRHKNSKKDSSIVV